MLFKKRYNMKCRSVHKVSMNAVQNAINKLLPRLKRILATYTPKDVWKANEFGFFCCQPLTWTLPHNAESGFEKANSSITFLACCSIDRIDHNTLMIIGTAWGPWRFKEKMNVSPGFE